MASCRLCGDVELEDEDMCPGCQLCPLCCRCDESDALQLADELSDMQDEDRGYYWERY